MRLGKFIIALIWCLAALPATAGQSVLLGEDDMAAAVAKEFGEQGIDGRLEFEFFGGKTGFVIENAKAAKIMISGLKIDAASNKFTAQAEIFADGTPFEQTILSGKYYTMGEAWVPAENIEKDTVITEKMLKTIPIRLNRVKAVNITDKSKLIDLQAKKSLKEGKIINEKDVGPVMLVKKGKIVTSVYRAKGMQITAQAEVLEDGAKGQAVEVMNTKSGKKFTARVVDSDTVEINAD